MAYGNPIGVTLPIVGVTPDAEGEQAFIDFLNAVNTVLAAKVTPAGIDINADLSFRSGTTAYAATDMQKAAFSNQSVALAAASHPVALYTAGSAGDLFFNDAGGHQIQVTAAGGVNVSTSGGITGAGYGSSGVEVNYDAGNAKYRMRSGVAADAFADVECGDLRLNDTSGNFLTITSSSSMAADYTLRFMAALPAANALLSVNAAGTISASNALQANADITLSGTGDYKHGDKVLNIPALAGISHFVGTDWRANIPSDNTAMSFANPSDTTRLAIPITLRQGDRIKSVLVRLKDTAGGHFLNFQLWRTTDPDNAVQLGSTQVSAGTGANQTLTISAVNFTITTADFLYGVILANDSTTTTHRVTGLEVTYDRP